MKQARDRERTRQWMAERGLLVFDRSYVVALNRIDALVVKWERRPMPFLMWLIGDEGLYGVGIPTNTFLTVDERQRIEHDFPEAGFAPYGVE